MNFYKTFLNQVVARKQQLIIGVLALTAVLGVSAFIGKQEPTVVSEYTVTKTTLENSIRVFGKAEPDTEYQLSFQINGKVIAYPYEVGDTVKKGSELARLDTKDIANRIREATSKIAIETSKKKELAAPVRSNELVALESRIAQAETALSNSESALSDELLQAAAEFDQLFNDYAEPYFGTPNKIDKVEVVLENTTVNSVDESALLAYRESIMSGIAALRSNNSTDSKLTQASNLAQTFAAFSQKLEDVAEGSVDEDIVDAVADDMDPLNTGAVTVSKNITTKRNQYDLDKKSLVVAENELEVAKIGTAKETIALQDSVINDKRAQLTSLYNDLSEYTLKSPIAGKVFQTFVTLYENISANEPVITIVKDEPFVVRSDVAESDIVYVGIGNKATVTFDAIPDKEYQAEVTFIEEATSADRTVSTYETTFTFVEDQDLSGIKSGMTANVTAFSGSVPETVAIPSAYIITSDNQQVVNVKDPTTLEITERVITTGYRTNTGLTEIKSGVSEGETIVILK